MVVWVDRDFLSCKILPTSLFISYFLTKLRTIDLHFTSINIYNLLIGNINTIILERLHGRQLILLVICS